MALHGSDNRHLGVSPTGATMVTGFSLDLPLDTIGIFSKDARKATKKGLKALQTFEGLDKRADKIAILNGTTDLGGKEGDKNSRSMDFTLSEVVKVGIANPKVKEQTFDYWRVGWDGIHDDSTIKFSKGQTLEFQMTIGGIAATFFNDVDRYTVRKLINIPNDEIDGICDELGDVCAPVDCREHTIGLVKGLNDHLLPGGQKLSQFFDIYPIFDTVVDPKATTEYTQYCLDYCGFGGEYEISKVAAQYPGVEVKRDTFTNKFVIYQKTTDTAPVPYVATKGGILKGCEECPTGYTEIPEGVVYGVALEDDGVDQKALVQALPGAVASSAIKTGQDFGVGHYIVVLTDELTQVQEAAFITANKTAIIKFMGTKEAFCNDTSAPVSSPWVACGTCETTTAKYRLMVADNCNKSRLEEVQDAYPDLVVTEVINKNCVSVFETTVETTPSCSEGCNPAIVQQVFNSEAPRGFGMNNFWYPVEPVTAEGTTKCGFEIKGKPIIMNPSECTYDELPFIATSSKIISLSGGYPIDYSYNSIVPKGTWRVLELDRARDLDNLGGNLREWEQKGRFYFKNEKPFRSAVERSLTGSESRLDGLTQYSQLSLTIEGENKAGMNSKEYKYISYKVLVPFGRTTKLEELFRNVAGAAGLNFEVK